MGANAPRKETELIFLSGGSEQCQDLGSKNARVCTCCSVSIDQTLFNKTELKTYHFYTMSFGAP